MMGLGMKFGDTESGPLPLFNFDSILPNSRKDLYKIVSAKDLQSRIAGATQDGVPILFCFRIVFKSAHKLVPK